MFGVPENTEITADAGEQVEQGEVQGFKAPASQEELDRIIQKRIDRERAKFADYDDLKARADNADALKATNDDLASKVQTYEARDARSALVTKIAGEIGVDASVLAEMRGDTDEELRAKAELLKDRLKLFAPAIPSQDKRPEGSSVDESQDFMRRLLGKDA